MDKITHFEDLPFLSEKYVFVQVARSRHNDSQIEDLCVRIIAQGWVLGILIAFLRGCGFSVGCARWKSFHVLIRCLGLVRTRFWQSLYRSFSGGRTRSLVQGLRLFAGFSLSALF